MFTMLVVRKKRLNRHYSKDSLRRNPEGVESPTDSRGLNKDLGRTRGNRRGKIHLIGLGKAQIGRGREKRDVHNKEGLRREDRGYFGA